MDVNCPVQDEVARILTLAELSGQRFIKIILVALSKLKMNDNTKWLTTELTEFSIFEDHHISECCN